MAILCRTLNGNIESKILLRIPSLNFFHFHSLFRNPSFSTFRIRMFILMAHSGAADPFHGCCQSSVSRGFPTLVYTLQSCLECTSFIIYRGRYRLNGIKFLILLISMKIFAQARAFFFNPFLQSRHHALSLQISSPTFWFTGGIILI